MKKYLLIIIFSIFLLGGCSIKYSSNVDDPDGSTDTENSENNNNDDTTENNGNENTDEKPDLEETIKHDIIAPISINESALFYPYNLTNTSKKVLEYSYIDSSNLTKYKIYSAYYSEYYDTLYIAYDSIDNPVQTLKAKDLYQIERHALNYYESDPNKTDYKDYLKAVLIYPDTIGSSCRKGISDEASITINGCANYVGKEAVISLNRIQSLDHFYNDRIETIDKNRHLPINAMRYTFAHEFGHVSTFYHMAYKNDEDYEDYLKLRLGNYYSAIYPNGLPAVYSSQDSDYYTQPTEILADDYVELFYNTSIKVEEDTYEYTLNQEFTRNSLMNYSSIRFLSENNELYTTLKDYYTTNFLDYTNKAHFESPIVISSSSKKIEYYDGYSKIGKDENLKTINSKHDSVNLIAVATVIVDKVKYYRVILSNTFNVTTTLDEKQTAKKMGYVKAGAYSINNQIKIYEINYDRSNNSYMSKRSMAGINNYDNIYILPYYDFSYVLNLTKDVNTATTYDYLNSNISNQKYTVNIYSFGTLVN